MGIGVLNGRLTGALLAVMLPVFAQVAPEVLTMQQHRAGPQPGPRAETRRAATVHNTPLEKIQPKLRALATGDSLIPVFVLLSDQPQPAVFGHYREAFRDTLERAHVRLQELHAANIGRYSEVRQAQDDLDSVKIAMRQAAFREIDMLLAGPQTAMSAKLTGLGARRIGRYQSVNMLTAEIPGSALAALEADPSVAAVFLAERHTTQINVSVPALGAPAFWTAGFSGAGQSVALLDTGVRTDHPAFVGKAFTNKVFLDYGSMASCFADDKASPQDLYGHGTHIAGIIMSQGSTGYESYLGVAKGLTNLYNLKIAYAEKGTTGCSGTASSDSRDTWNALDWALRNTPVDIFNYSLGSAATVDDDPTSRQFDQFMDTYQALVMIAAGNFGPTEGTVASPGTSYNGITVANWTTRGTVADSSGRGPTIGGRYKPDLTAPGTGIVSTAYNWSDSGAPDFVSKSGTSMATPHITGSAALLASTGVSNPLAMKAVLLNSTDNTGWASDSGWGYANLTYANGVRAYYRTGAFGPSETAPALRFYRVPAPGRLWSLVTWNRHVDSLLSSYFSDLNLFVYDAATQALMGESSTADQNVEQVYVNSPQDVVVKVRLDTWGGGGFTNENFGLSFSSPNNVLSGPILSVSCSPPTSVVALATFGVGCSVTNIGDLVISGAAGQVTFDGAFTGAASEFTYAFGALAPGATSPVVTHHFTAPAALSSYHFTQSASGASFDETIRAASTSPIQVVSAPPLVTNVFPANGATCVPRAGTILSWTAATGALSYDVYYGNPTPTNQANTAATSYRLPFTLSSAQTLYWQINTHLSSGTNLSPVWSFTACSAPAVNTHPHKVGTDHGGTWNLDVDGNGYWSAGDKAFIWGSGTSVPVVGDWNGDGKSEIGVYENGIWYLDMDGNGIWSAGDKAFAWGFPGTSTPVVGDWNGDGKDEWGVFDNGLWFLDVNASTLFDAGDLAFGWGTPRPRPWWGIGTATARRRLGPLRQGSGSSTTTVQ